MTYINMFGTVASTQWEASLWINSVDGGLLTTTGMQSFTNSRWKAAIEAVANYSTCYQGKSYATAGGDVKQVGGNHVCTDPRPVFDTPPCDDDCQSPIVLDPSGHYRMTSLIEGVHFDIDGDGVTEAIAWTQPDSATGFLAFDRNGNGAIDSGGELFGNNTRLADGSLASNGFDALTELDGNHDGRVDASDPAWWSLLFWRDANHDGVSASSELSPLAARGISTIRTDYKRSGRKDAFRK